MNEFIELILNGLFRDQSKTISSDKCQKQPTYLKANIIFQLRVKSEYQKLQQFISLKHNIQSVRGNPNTAMPQTRSFVYILIVALSLTLITCQQQSPTPQLTTSDFQVTPTDPDPTTITHDQSSFLDFKTNLENNLNEQYEQMKQLQKESKQSMQKLQQFDKQVRSWSQLLQKINNFIHGFNSVLSSFNDKATTMMARVVGFEQELKAIISIDTLIVCVLSLILVKILKDQFIEEGYQPVGGVSQNEAGSANVLVNNTLGGQQGQ